MHSVFYGKSGVTFFPHVILGNKVEDWGKDGDTHKGADWLPWIITGKVAGPLYHEFTIVL
jgi:hypothetical protein